MKRSAVCLTLFLITGCTKIPDADIAFLDARVPLGMAETEARGLVGGVVVRRGPALPQSPKIALVSHIQPVYIPPQIRKG